MYSPAYNRIEDRAELLAFLRANNFALLVTGTGGALHASHLPAIVEERTSAAQNPRGGGSMQLVLVMHMAKANLQWREFFDDEVLVVFSGPHAYVSPRWYEQNERVPTWNYAAVHAYGKVKIMDTREAKHAAQAKLVAAHDPAWLPTFESLRKEYVDDMLDGIVNFEIEVSRIETRWKLSQNRGRREQELIVAELEKSADGVARSLAALTRKHLVSE
ncbi:MAG: FMN-binding negative transcriptional regulator [Betaproteobacteria bacterium]|nr:FMN-binding negative transcriptional regulator [Betaproteobacteria bacterium]